MKPNTINIEAILNIVKLSFSDGLLKFLITKKITIKQQTVIMPLITWSVPKIQAIENKITIFRNALPAMTRIVSSNELTTGHIGTPASLYPFIFFGSIASVRM